MLIFQALKKIPPWILVRSRLLLPQEDHPCKSPLLPHTFFLKCSKHVKHVHTSVPLQTLVPFLAEWRNPSALPSVILAWVPKPYATTFNSINMRSLLLPENSACLPLFCQQSPHPHLLPSLTQGERVQREWLSSVGNNSTLAGFNYSISVRSRDGLRKEWTLTAPMLGDISFPP